MGAPSRGAIQANASQALFPIPLEGSATGAGHRASGHVLSYPRRAARRRRASRRCASWRSAWAATTRWLHAPMIWEGRGIGAINVARVRHARRSPTRRSRCSKTFADQAVIAIQNARLFKEAQEARAAGRGRQRSQERLPGDDEPRDPHADERRHRHERAAARHAADRRAARLRQHHPRQRRLAADDHQRHPRLLEDRGRAHGHRAPPLRPARVRRIGAGPDRPRARPRSTWTSPMCSRGDGAGRPSTAT